MVYKYFVCGLCGNTKRTDGRKTQIRCCKTFHENISTKDNYIRTEQRKKTAAQPSTSAQPAIEPAAAPFFDSKAGFAPATVAADLPANTTQINLMPEFKKNEENISISETEKERVYQCGACGGRTKSRDRCDSCGVAFQ